MMNIAPEVGPSQRRRSESQSGREEYGESLSEYELEHLASSKHGNQGFYGSVVSLLTRYTGLQDCSRKAEEQVQTAAIREKSLSNVVRKRERYSSDASVLDFLDTKAPFPTGPWATGSVEVVALALATYLCIVALVVRITEAKGYTADMTNVTTLEKLGHQVAAIAFLVAALICLQESVWSSCTVKKRISLWVFYINTVTMLTYFYFYLYGNPTVPTYWEGVETKLNHQENIGALRYVQWSFTTPAMIMVISRLVIRNPGADQKLWTIVMCDVAMVVTGFLERYLPSPYHEIFFTISCGCWLLVLRHLTELFNSAKALITPEPFWLKALYVHTMVTWTMFPVVRLLALWGYMTQSQEEMGFTLLDLVVKLVYAKSLMQFNNAVLDLQVLDKLKRMQGHLREGVHTNMQNDAKTLNSAFQAYDDKMLAYHEATRWREDRQEALLSQGFPMDKVTALLDFTLEDYISMSSGNINSYLRPPDQEHSQQNSN